MDSLLVIINKKRILKFLFLLHGMKVTSDVTFFRIDLESDLSDSDIFFA